MKKTLFALVLAASLVGITPVQAEEVVNRKVPVEIGEGVDTITIPLVINDGDVVIQAVVSKEKPTNKYGEMAVYRIQVFYPTEWGTASIQDHLTVDAKWSGLYTLTFKPGGETPWKFSFVLNLKNPLVNFDADDERERQRKDEHIAGLSKVFGNKQAKNLTLSPSFGLVEWTPAESRKLHALVGENTPEDDLLSVEKIQLPPQVDGQPPFTVEKVEMGWEIANRDGMKNLVSLEEISPFLTAVDGNPIRIKEGFLEWKKDLSCWVIVKNKTVFNVTPYMKYYVASKKATGH